MKNIFKTLLAVIALLPCALLFSACGGNGGGGKSMSISVNPAATFTVDGNDKIVAVTYDNEDAGRIYANVNFVGMKADDAVEVFVNISAVTGHLNFGSVSNEFKIVINGEAADGESAFKDKIQAQINASCEALGISASFDVLTGNEAMEDLYAKVCALMPEYTQADLQAMVAKDKAEFIEFVEEAQAKYAGLTYDQISEITNQFTSETGVKKYLLDAIATARATLNTLQKQLTNPFIPETAKAVAQAQLAAANTAIDDAINLLQEEVDKLVEAAETYASAAKINLKAEAKLNINKFKSTPKFYNLSEEQKAKINSIISVYFPES